MPPRRRAIVVWGLVGGLSFVVLVQGYELWAGTGVDALVKLGVALVVSGLAAAGVYLLGSLLSHRNESP